MNVIIIFIIIGLLIWCRYLHKNVEGIFTDDDESQITKYIAYLGKYVPEGGTALDFSNVVGIQGPAGPVGGPGPQGNQGDRGEKGNQGDRGEKGNQGDRGEKGEQGYPGERGQYGATGAKGDTGSTLTSETSRANINSGFMSLFENIKLIELIDKNKNEGFTQDDEDQDEDAITTLVYFNTLINTYLLDYIYTNPAGATGAVGASGKDGVKGDIGATGKDGAKGATGVKGIKGDDGFNGSSIFDVSKFRLNGDTDLFKKRRKKDDDSDEPQPSTAYTTLFN